MYADLTDVNRSNRRKKNSIYINTQSCAVSAQDFSVLAVFSCFTLGQMVYNDLIW